MGFWADLDCQQVEVRNNTFEAHPWSAILYEGANNVYAGGNNIDNSDGYGNAFGEDFIQGAISICETTNATIEGNTISNSVRAIVIRQSNRSVDWFNPTNSTFVNFAWPTASGGVRYWITAGNPTPVPGVTDRANMWSGNITVRNNILNGCDRVYISEGTNAGGMNVVGSIPLSSVVFTGNNYAGSAAIRFYDRSNTGLTLAQWKALTSYQRDQ